MWTKIKLVFFLLLAILGNPLYQWLSVFLAASMGWSESSGFLGKTHQVNLLGYVFFLVLIFLIRYMFYSKRFTGSYFNTEFGGEDSFLYIFARTHVFHWLGMYTLILWTLPLEGSYVSIVIIYSLATWIILTTINFFLLRRAKKKWLEANPKS